MLPVEQKVLQVFSLSGYPELSSLEFLDVKNFEY